MTKPHQKHWLTTPKWTRNTQALKDELHRAFHLADVERVESRRTQIFIAGLIPGFGFGFALGILIGMLKESFI